MTRPDTLDLVVIGFAALYLALVVLVYLRRAIARRRYWRHGRTRPAHRRPWRQPERTSR